MIIISKCPCRVSLLGGSSDLEWFVSKYGRGFSIGFSLPIFSRVAVGYRSGHGNRGLLNYSSREEYINIKSISHPIIRASLIKFSIKDPIELASFGDALMGGGLGSSSSFAVALIKAIMELKDEKIGNKDAAHLACELEINDLKNPIGRQDQYLCSLGGINFLEFNKNGHVEQHNYSFIEKAITKYANKLFLLNTSIKRSASKQLTIIKNQEDAFLSIEKILKIADKFIDKSKDEKVLDNIINYLEESLKESWEIKKRINGVLNNQLLEIQELISKYNFEIIKILGAGGGGYILIKHIGSDLEGDKKNIEKFNLNVFQINVHKQGCETWRI